MKKEFRYSELFFSPQGEGFYTGFPTVWLRLFGCNFQCQGFGQKNLSDKDSWETPIDDLDITQYKTLEEIPIFQTGCDTSYSWHRKFRHLAKSEDGETIAKNLCKLLVSPHNPTGTFLNAKSKQETHLAFTGGEPMMNQPAMIAVIESLAELGNPPRFVTVETNGTRPVKEELADLLYRFYSPSSTVGLVPDERGPTEWFWSVSPKLKASGEPFTKAIKPDILEQYSEVSDRGQLKFVVDGSDKVWDEVDEAVQAYREAEIYWPVWIMPVGATVESQCEDRIADIVDETIARGFNVSARMHCYIYGNRIGK